MCKMKICSPHVVDVGELIREIEEFLMNADSFDPDSEYDRGQKDELAWVVARLRALPEERAY